MYYGYKLRPDNSLFYEIKRDLVTHGPFRGKVHLGRLYHKSPPPGVNAPITFFFEPYRELGLFELLADVPRIWHYKLEWHIEKMLIKDRTKAKAYWQRKRF